MNNFDGYVTNLVYGVILLIGYSFCGIIPTILGFLTWFLIDKILEPKLGDEKKSELVALAAGVLVAIVCTFALKGMVAAA